MADPAEFNRKVKVLFMSCGSLENPDALKRHQEQLVAAGITNRLHICFPRHRARMADMEKEPVYVRSPAVQVTPFRCTAAAMKANGSDKRPFKETAHHETSTILCFIHGHRGCCDMSGSDR